MAFGVAIFLALTWGIWWAPDNPDQNTAHTLPSSFAIFSGAFRPRRIHGQSIARSPSNDNVRRTGECYGRLTGYSEILRVLKVERS